MFRHTSIHKFLLPWVSWSWSIWSWSGRPAAPHELRVAQRLRELASLDHGHPAAGQLGVALQLPD